MKAVRWDRGRVRNFDLALELFALRLELPGILVSHRLSGDAAGEAFATAAARDKSAIKVVMQPCAKDFDSNDTISGDNLAWLSRK